MYYYILIDPHEFVVRGTKNRPERYVLFKAPSMRSQPVKTLKGTKT